MAIEIVSFPINSMVIFHSYVNVYQRVTTKHDWWYHQQTWEIQLQRYRTGAFVLISPCINRCSLAMALPETVSWRDCDESWRDFSRQSFQTIKQHANGPFWMHFYPMFLDCSPPKPTNPTMFQTLWIFPPYYPSFQWRRDVKSSEFIQICSC
jgi:hypothetical protein